MAEDSDIFFDYSGRDVEEKDGSVCFCEISFIKRIPMPGSLNFKTELNIFIGKKRLTGICEGLGHFVSRNYFVK